MLNGGVFVIGLAMGGGWRSLLPRTTDLRDAFRMVWYYIGMPVARLTRRSWPHPRFSTKYNALQRVAYFSVPVAGLLSVLTGWAIHKPMQLHWLAAIFGGYDKARIWHFWLMWFLVLFVVPHVILVLADGWDTLRSMITGWSRRHDKATTSGLDPSSPCGSEANPSSRPSSVFRKQPVPTKSLRDRNLVKAGCGAAPHLHP
jgi:thiosulfate reductase cytochrome b subunit